MKRELGKTAELNCTCYAPDGKRKRTATFLTLNRSNFTGTMFTYRSFSFTSSS